MSKRDTDSSSGLTYTSPASPHRPFRKGDIVEVCDRNLEAIGRQHITYAGPKLVRTRDKRRWSAISGYWMDELGALYPFPSIRHAERRSKVPDVKPTHTRRNTCVSTPSYYEPAAVAAVRGALDVSYKEFAAMLGVSIGRVTAWETGKTEIPLLTRRLFDVIRNDVARFKKITTC